MLKKKVTMTEMESRDYVMNIINVMYVQQSSDHESEVMLTNHRLTPSVLPVGIGSPVVSAGALSSVSFSQRATVRPFHSCTGSNSTATTSPWIARFRALAP